MGKKSYETATNEYFNETPYGNSKKLRQQILAALNEVAEKYDVAPINLRNRGYVAKWHDRAWIWRADFFHKDLTMVESTHNDWPERFWLDNLIRQTGCMVWNLTNDTIILEYRNGGTWPGAEKLPRKRRGAEAVAEHFANKEKEEFCLKFK